MRTMSDGLILLVACICLTGVCTAEIPDLVGTWEGHITAHIEGTGFVDAPDNGTVIMNVTEQKDRMFAGDIKIMKKDGTYLPSETLAGMIEANGAEFYIIEHDEGFSLGDILGPDEIELMYVEDSHGATAIIASNHLFRVNKGEKSEAA